MAETVNEQAELALKYQKMDPRDHCLLRPGMYVGGIHAEQCSTWVLDDPAQGLVKRSIEYIPALYKVFDEILVNAVDHSTRLAAAPDTTHRYGSAPALRRPGL